MASTSTSPAPRARTSPTRWGETRRSCGKAPIGYLNVRENFECREVRTIVLDPERAPLVRMAFELYATGSYEFHALIELLTNAGLRTKPTKRNPAGIPVSINELGSCSGIATTSASLHTKASSIRDGTKPLSLKKSSIGSRRR